MKFLYISKKKTITLLYIWVASQLSIWYGGLAKLIPPELLNWWNILQNAALISIICLFIVKKKTINKVTWVLMFMKIWLVFVTYINNRPLEMMTVCRYLCIILLIDFFADKAPKELVSSFMFIFEFLVYYNFYTCVQKGPNIYGAFYGALGYDNDFTRFMLVAYFLAVLHYGLFQNKIRCIVLLFTIHATLIYTWSVTGLCAILVIDSLLAFNYFFQMKVGLLKGYLLFLVAEFAIVVLRLQNVFSYIIVEVLNKDLTFTGRINIWERSIKLISERLILGWGSMTQETEHLILGDVYCHNALLEQLFRGGIIYYLLFVTMIVIAAKYLQKFYNNIIIQQLCIVVFSFWVVCITESILEDYVLYIAFAFLYVVPKLIKQSGTKVGIVTLRHNKTSVGG